MSGRNGTHWDWVEVDSQEGLVCLRIRVESGWVVGLAWMAWIRVDSMWMVTLGWWGSDSRNGSDRCREDWLVGGVWNEAVKGVRRIVREVSG